MSSEKCQYCSNTSTRYAHNRFKDATEHVCEIHYAYIKPSSARVNPINIGRCIRCGVKSTDKYGEKERLIDHHVNYPLDLTVPVCDSCHQQIHNQEPDDRYLESWERGNTPFMPVGNRREDGMAIHRNYKSNGEPRNGGYCPDCGVSVIYAPDEMGHTTPDICPNSDCRTIEVRYSDLLQSRKKAHKLRYDSGFESGKLYSNYDMDMGDIECEHCGTAVQEHNMRVTNPKHALGPNKWVCPNCAVNPNWIDKTEMNYP